LELVHTFEAYFRTEEIQPFDDEVAPLPEGASTEHVHLQPWLVRILHGWTQAIVGDAVANFRTADLTRPHRINTKTRPAFRVPRKVQGRETERTAQALAAHDPSLAQVAVAQQRVCHGHL